MFMGLGSRFALDWSIIIIIFIIIASLRLVRVSSAYPTITHPPVLNETEQPEICCWRKAEW